MKLKFLGLKWFTLVAVSVLLMATFARANAAVTVSAFTAQAQTTQIVLTWTTASEINTAGYIIYRSASPNGPVNSKINNSNIPATCLNSVCNTKYSFTDTTATKGQKYYYKLMSVEFDNSIQSCNCAVVSAQINSPTPTTAAPTATTGPSSTATNTSVPGTATATVYSSPTPQRTPPPTNTPMPSLVAYVVGVPTFTPQPGNKAAPPKPAASNAQPSNSSAADATASPIVQAKSANTSNNPGSSASQDDATDTPDTSTTRALPQPIQLIMFGAASLLAITSLAFGAVALYFVARRYIG